ncbi:STAS domain-containing protein [Streptomyces sp. NPDC006458]|uniref:STAS domain-containing protein n=1 Tax=Streptomyces sp. NPDC006458 TaxID=3154302 RepID=UPI0033AE2038
MAADPHAEAAAPAPLSVTEADGCATLRFTGELTADTALDLEQKLLDPCLSQARAWVLDLTGLAHMDLNCAYALLRAAVRLPRTTTVQVRGARRNVQRTLRHTGFDALASID